MKVNGTKPEVESECFTRTKEHTPDWLVEQYIKLRDHKKELEDALVQRLAPIRAVMSQLEGWMMEDMQQAGLKSLPTRAGTAYQSTRTSARVTDWTQTLAFIREKEAWELLERRVSKLAVEAWMKEFDEAVPGVETSTEIVVNVRRSGEKA